jgi:hypothetical protein
MLGRMPHDASSLACSLIHARGGSDDGHEIVLGTLERFGSDALRFAGMHGIRIVPLQRAEAYSSASPAIARMGINVDAWPAPPAGLFVVEERSVYLRSRSPMTVAHEFGHGLDCALGGGIYRSGIDPRIREAYANARAFVTPYAATALDEYFAECLRAYVEVNDPASVWPPATRARLRRVDPEMYAYVEDIFRNDFRAAA